MSGGLKNGDVVLVTFPFTDLTGVKLRPAAIISTDSVHRATGDYTLVFISSVIPDEAENFEVIFAPHHPDFKKSGLKKTSVFKMNKITTVTESLVRSKLGVLGSRIRKELSASFKKAVGFDDI